MTEGGLGRRFWLLWSAFTATNLADGLSLVAFPLLAVSLTDDARLVALVSAARILPFPIIGLPAGLILDRFDRRSVSQLAQVGRGTMLGVVAVVVGAGAANIPLLVGAAFAFGAGEVLTDGGLPALVRDIVNPDHLEVANSRLSAVQTVTNMFFGPPVGALLFTFHPTAPFWVAAVLAVAAAGVLVLLPGSYRPDRSETDQDPGDDPVGLGTRLTAGLRYVWGHEVLRPLALTVAVFAFVGEAANAVFVILATRRLGLSEFEYGLLIAVDGVTAVIFSFFVAGLVRRFGHARTMRFAVVTSSASMLIYGTTPAAGGAVAGAVLGGVSDPSWNINSATIRQRLVPDDIFGRMMTAYLVIAWGMQPVGAFMGGVIAEAWGPRWVYILSGAVVGSLLILGRPLFSAIDRTLNPPGGPAAVEPDGATGA